MKKLKLPLVLAALMVSGITVAQKQDSTREKKIDEVVLIGYGSTKKKDATGALTSVKAEDFNKGTNTSPEQLLQGKAAGVQITSASGDPNGKSSVRIRGFSSIRSGTDPLYVIDGVPISSGDSSSGRADIGFGSGGSNNPMNFINPSDIESMDVLKDASATAIYGSRGANGVILITTKKGKKGIGQLSFATTAGFSNVSKKYDILTASEYAAKNPSKNFGSDVDAFKEITRGGSNQQYDLSYGGGTDNGSYRISLGYLDQKGVLKNSGQNKTNISYNLIQNFFDKKFRLESSFSASFIKSYSPPLAEAAGAEGDLIISALRWNPTRALYDANDPSGYTIVSDNPRNPLNLLNYYTDYTKTFRTVGNITGTLRLIKGLEYKVNFGVDYSSSQRSIAASYYMNNRIVSDAKGAAGISNIYKYNHLIEHTLNYESNITNDLKLNALAGYSYQEFDNYGQNFAATNFVSADGVPFRDQNYYLDYISISNTQNTSDTGYFTQGSYHAPNDKLQSMFGRAIVSYKNKYILNATVRRDGSSKFGDNHKYGTFPAISVAWNIDKEDFLPKVFNSLKLRGGWGITGNQDFNSGRSQENWQAFNGTWRGINVKNEDLKWEETMQYNAGVDFGILQNKLTGSLDFYNKTTKDLLWPKYVILYPSDTPYQWRNLDNTRIKSKGIEFSLNYKLISSDNLNIEIGGNGSYNITKATGVAADGFTNPWGIETGVLNGQGLTDEFVQGHIDGGELYTFYLRQFVGFDSNGLSIYKTEDGGTTTDLGKAAKMASGSALPKYNVGLYVKGNYKDFDFTINGYGQYGGKVYDNTANALFYRDAFTGGTNVTMEVANNNEASKGNSNAASTRFLHSSDFFRLANMSIGYTLKGEGGVFNYVKSVRINITGQNLFVITGYDGFDPEVNTNKAINGVPSYGVDYASYPKARIISAGINVNF